MMWLYLIVGIIVGIAIAYLLLSSKLKVVKVELNQYKELITNLRDNISEKDLSYKELATKTEEKEKYWIGKEAQFNSKLSQTEESLKQRDSHISDLIEAKNTSEKQHILSKAKAESENAILKEQLESVQKVLKDQEEKFSKIEENFKNQFKTLAQEILEEKSKTFTEIGKKDLQELIIPLKEKLQDFSKQVRESYDSENRERFNLKEEIKRLNEMNIKLSDQANNLATALKGDSKTQGDWGEMILENMLSDSGLTLGREYLKQESVRDEEGKQLRPDFVIKYPDNRFLIIDSKVSLRSYEAYTASNDIKEKKTLLEQFLKAVNDRMMELSSKKYQDQFEGSPDFVMMFMPVEPAFMLAIQSDPTLWNRAYEKRVIIISPTNLIAALKMINELWKHDAQNKNTVAISEAAANLYDKFVGLYTDLDDISKSMEKVTSLFNDAKGKLQTGKGNLISRVEHLKKLGIKTKKELNIKQIDYDLNLEGETNEES